jgi:uncharacterized protein YerC
MPRVSKNILSEKMQKQITDALFVSLAKMRDTAAVASFMRNLLTPTERVMLAKRLMVALLIKRGLGYQKICKALKISHATVNVVRREFAQMGDGYRLAARLVEEELGDKFFEDIIRAGKFE